MTGFTLAKNPRIRPTKAFTFYRQCIRVIRTITKLRLLTKIDFNLMHLVSLCKKKLAKIANWWLMPPSIFSNF